MTDLTPVLVLVDQAEGLPRSTAFELLTAARDLGEVHAVWIGDGADDAAARLGEFGAVVVHVIPCEPAASMPPAVAAAVAGVLEAVGARALLLASTFENKEVAARVALAVGAGLVVDASAVGLDGGAIVTTQQAFAATWTLRGQVTTARAVVALKPHAGPARALESPRVPTIRTHDAVAPDPRVRLVERAARPSSGRPDLGDAQIVVVGGRGTGGDFTAVEDLADALGGAVGATRVATDEGWIGHEAQIGQTGVSVSPRLYIGAGVSGAVHHRGGMVASGTVVAVDTDADAPIFEFADFGVVGDLFTVLPQAAEEVRRLRAEG